MLYLFMVAYKAACQTLSKAFLKSMKTWKRSCWCWRYLSQRIRRLICSMVLLPALKPACSSAMFFSACGFNLFSLIFSMTLLGWLMRLIVRYFWHCCRLPLWNRFDIALNALSAAKNDAFLIPSPLFIQPIPTRKDVSHVASQTFCYLSECASPWCQRYD